MVYINLVRKVIRENMGGMKKFKKLIMKMILTRVVRMEFHPEKVQNFLELFDAYKNRIRSTAGCRYLALLRDAEYPNVFYTYSKWDREADLETYRKGEVFKTVWSKTKKLFSARPLAYSMYEMDKVEV